MARNAARANGSRDARHQLAHVQFAHPDDLPRFRALGVIANVTPLWARMEEYERDLTLPFVSSAAAGEPTSSTRKIRGSRPARAEVFAKTPTSQAQLMLNCLREPSGTPYVVDVRQCPISRV